jgi:hypothetical protein
MALGIDLYIYTFENFCCGLVCWKVYCPRCYHKIDWLVKKTVFRNVLYATKKYGNLLYATKKNALDTFSCKRQIFF